MKASLYVFCALIATNCNAINSLPNDDFVDLQIGVEAQARTNIREMLRANLRAALYSNSSEEMVERNLVMVRDDDMPTVEDARR